MSYEGSYLAFNVYIAALHYAIMTITSIGYGDISPVQFQEYVLGCVAQIIGGVVWATSVGSICAMLTTSDPAALKAKQILDELNGLIHTNGIPDEMAVKLRAFFLQSRAKREAEVMGELLNDMSPQLQSKVV